jgi:hypothetical protein
MSDGNYLINRYCEVENGSQVQKIGYIMQTPEGDWSRSLESSHFNSWMDNRNEKEEGREREGAKDEVSVC